jgi:hypothetical protein
MSERTFVGVRGESLRSPVPHFSVAFRVKRRHFYFFILSIPLFSLFIEKKLRQHVVILPNMRQKIMDDLFGFSAHKKGGHGMDSLQIDG